MSQFITKDSGKREQFTSGMQRDTQSGKTLYHLVFDGPMFERWAGLLTRGAEKYDEGNWLKAEGEAELRRFKASAVRHFVQWYRGDTDEDHAAAVIFNLNGAEYVKGKIMDAKLNQPTGDFEYDEARRIAVQQEWVDFLSSVPQFDGTPIPVDADPFDQQHDPDYVSCDLDKCGTTDGTTPITFDTLLANGGGVIVRRSHAKAEAAVAAFWQNWHGEIEASFAEEAEPKKSTWADFIAYLKCMFSVAECG